MEDLIIKKDNRIVQKTMNKFSYKQNQLMAVLLGKYINLNTNECIDTKISIDEIREVLGIKSSGGNAYERIRKAIERFGENGSVGIYSEKNGKPKWTWMPYFTKIEIDENDIQFEWNSGMKPYLLELKANYTQYLANDYLKLHSMYSQNLYEQLKSFENFKNKYKKNPQLSVEEIRNVFQVSDSQYYATFYRLHQKILKKAVAEINKVTDLSVSYKLIKVGKAVVSVEFDINRKELHKPIKKKREQYKELTGQELPQEAIQKPDPDLLAQLQAIQKQHKENN